MSSPKTIRDLPHFSVAEIVPGQKRRDEYLSFELKGRFDKLDGVRDGRCWLLLPERNCLIGDLEELDQIAGTSVYKTCTESEPPVLGSALPYVDGYWQAFHVWMVAEPLWIWEKTEFQLSDAVGRRFTAKQPQLIEGQEVWDWIEVLKEPGGRGRYYPVFPGDPPKYEVGPETGVVKGGWDHEHCQLCHQHIEAGSIGYVDRSDHWVCDACFWRYVAVHDLAFLDELR